MKTDDPHLEESRSKLLLAGRAQEVIHELLHDEMVLEHSQYAVVDLLNALEHDDLTFAQKAKLCEELKPAEIEPPIWNVLDAANKLRNKIAHTLDEAEIQPRMDKLRDAYLAALTPTQRKGAEELDDVRIAASAFELCGSYLVGATVAAQAAKKTAATSG